MAQPIGSCRTRVLLVLQLENPALLAIVDILELLKLRPALFQTCKRRAHSKSYKRLRMCVDVSTRLLEDVSHLGDDLAQLCRVDVGQACHVDVRLVSLGYSLQKLGFGEYLAPGAKPAIAFTNELIARLAILLSSRLNCAIDLSPDAAEGVPPWASCSCDLSFAVLVGDLEVGAPLGFVAQAKERGGEQNVVCEDDDLVLFGQPCDALRDLIDATVVKARNWVVEDHRRCDTGQPRFCKEVGKCQHLLLSFGEHLRRLVSTAHNLAALRLPLAPDELKFQGRRTQGIALLEEERIEALVDQLITSVLGEFRHRPSELRQ